MEKEEVSFTKFDGVYIVTKHRNPAITMTKFYDLIREVDPPLTIEVSDILKKPLKTIDGQELDLNVGALVLVTRLQVEKGFKFHFANLGPGTESSIIQYEYALSKLGLGPEPKFDRALINLDEKFKSLFSDLQEGKKSS